MGVLLAAQEKPQIVYTDASAFPLYGKALENTSARYERLPASLQGVVRDQLWDLGRNSAGLYIRFRTDATVIRARWESTNGFTMNHMTPTGIRGLDLYALEDGQWRFVESGRPGSDRVTDAKIISDMDPVMREYMLYLSLYDGVTSLEIGVNEGAVLEAPAVNRPSSEKPVVMYGTSILQGGCVSRPGMSSTAILGRKLDREVINLGFSGNGQLDYEIARIMADIPDPAVYVLDNVPNCLPELIYERTENFVKILRDAHPDVPIIFVEDPHFPYMIYDKLMYEEVTSKNAAEKEVFGKLKKQGMKRIYYVSSDDMIGDDAEATVDGLHFTDLGMTRYVDLMLPVIKKAIKKTVK